jgi:hypothetical protein
MQASRFVKMSWSPSQTKNVMILTITSHILNIQTIKNNIIIGHNFCSAIHINLKELKTSKLATIKKLHYKTDILLC